MLLNVKKYRLLLVLSLAVITPLGFYTKYYSGPAGAWVGNSLGGLVYEVFWCLVAGLLFPRTKPLSIALWVFVVTSILELLQLWHPPFLTDLRSTFLGRTILGNVFSVMDFPYYLAGCLLGYYLMRILARITGVSERTSGPPSR
jgi:hypothetical protein